MEDVGLDASYQVGSKCLQVNLLHCYLLSSGVYSGSVHLLRRGCRSDKVPVELEAHGQAGPGLWLGTADGDPYRARAALPDLLM